MRYKGFQPFQKQEIHDSSIGTQFIESFNELQYFVHETAKNKGWWNNPRNDSELIALMHCELSEAVEGLRKGNPPDDKIPAFSSVEAELADVILRIMDMAQARNYNISAAIIAKSNMNTTRENKHGGKLF